MKHKIRRDAESLDGHHAQAQAEGIGLTALYDVAQLAAARASLTPQEQRIYDLADVPTLLRLHAQLDAEVAAAYGWPWPMSDEEILARVVALNAERVEEERRGHVRWLRPDYQVPLFADKKAEAPLAAPPSRTEADVIAPIWPESMTARVVVVRDVLRASRVSLSIEEITARISRASGTVVREIVDTMVLMSLAERDEQGRVSLFLEAK